MDAPTSPTATTTPTGAWAPIYAERLHHIEGLAQPIDWANPPAGLVAWNAPFGEPEPTDAVAEDRTVEGPHGPVPLRIYRPSSGDASGVGLVWFHEGAFLGGDLDMPEADLASRGLVTRTGGVVVSVDYRLCQGGVHHPVPHDDCWAAWSWTHAHAAELGIDPARLAVGGTSAGGNLAAGVALRSITEDPRPAQALLVYPVAHAPLPQPSAELAACIAQMPPVLTFTNETDAINENYLGGPSATHAVPLAFPGHADDLAGYPRTYIENCEFDDLRASGERFGRQLAEAGVDVTVVTAAGVPHGHLNAIGSPLTHASLDRLANRLTDA
ncbi:alpha/beta hydrolase [Propioniciclava soli]|uniref:Alpha/beta hydrolase n=1 Tax=Propioniciclava soli TaxID=2775081 RepID=A0ABZ3C4U7_9ACTN